jgi:hypothetical protein
MYAGLQSSHPSLLVFSTHSTPYLELKNQGQEDARFEGNLAAYYLQFQFTNMELTHNSLKKLFVPLIHKLYPTSTHARLNSDLNEYFNLVATFNVPSIRSYLLFFLQSKQSLLSVVDSRIDVRSPSWLKHSSYSHFDTDNGDPNFTTSTFLRRAIQLRYSFTRRFEIAEENAICTAASIFNAEWKQMDQVQTKSSNRCELPELSKIPLFKPANLPIKPLQLFLKIHWTSTPSI